MVYEWGIDKYPVDAQIAGETIEALKSELGKDYIEAEDLLNASRAENAPLHSCFEWDDTIAAEKYRLNQAGDIIRNITVKIVDSSEKPQVVRAFVNVKPRNEKGEFVSIQTAMIKDEYRDQVLRNALNELQNFKRKYQSYTELRAVFKAIDEVANTLN